MRYKVELGFKDSNDDSKNVFYSTYVEADNYDEAVKLAKKLQTRERPDLKTTDRWFWSAYETCEDEQ